MRGPLPNPNGRSRARAKSTYEQNALPAAGRKGAVPKPPDWVTLGEAGMAWWRWAWKTPQAVKWSKADYPLIARRASMEDAFYALTDEPPSASLMKAMLDMEDRLGLSPKALAQLRWVIVDDPSSFRQKAGPTGEVIALTSVG